MLHARIIITGIVQGVGFRPFLYNLARNFGLTGKIKNSGNLGVIMDLETSDRLFSFENFIISIKEKAPKISYIEDISLINLENSDGSDFNDLMIVPSENSTGKGLTLPPDIAMCDRCLEDFKNKKLTRYYYYPFIACAQCGPRFTTMRKLPYDRNLSTMDEFPFCDGTNSCLKEYNNFLDRRFHAQTFGCRDCGPFYFTVGKDSKLPKIPKPDKIDTVARYLLDDKIAAIKGIGGVFLVCLADSENAIEILRNRKKDRKNKPFAIMVSSIDIAKRYCNIAEQYSPLLTSFRRPIILFQKGNQSLPTNLAPGLPNLGVILPYTGVHYQLFEEIDNRPIVYTSGNISSQPMAIENEIILDELHDVADIFYLHNRSIYQRCDDSVIRPHLGSYNIIRRSRGFVPEYIKLPFKSPFKAMIAVGPELNSTGSISRGSRIFPTQHIGNITNLENYQFLSSAILHMINLLNVKSEEIESIVHDLHPLFQSTKLAGIFQEKFGNNEGKSPIISSVQHHHAHLATLLIDNNMGLEEQLIGITVDGIGYGDDKQSWGGEILIGDYKNYDRAANLTPVPMVGGDLCAEYPGRMLLSMLLSADNPNHNLEIIEKLNKQLRLEKYFPQKELEYKFVMNQFKSAEKLTRKRFPLTTSLGRWLDAVSSLFNISQIRTYRGEPAMRLEGYIWNGIPQKHFELDDYLSRTEILSQKLFVDYTELLLKIPKTSNNQLKINLACSMVNDISKLFGKQAVSLSETSGINTVGITGGVAYNERIVSVIKKHVESNGLNFLQNKLIPCGDAGISLGQIGVAASRGI